MKQYGCNSIFAHPVWFLVWYNVHYPVNEWWCHQFGDNLLHLIPKVHSVTLMPSDKSGCSVQAKLEAPKLTESPNSNTPSIPLGFSMGGNPHSLISLSYISVISSTPWILKCLQVKAIIKPCCLIPSASGLILRPKQVKHMILTDRTIDYRCGNLTTSWILKRPNGCF